MLYQQPIGGVVRTDPAFAADFSWVFTGGGVGAVITADTSTKKATPDGVGISNGFITLSRAAPSLSSTSWTECGVVLMDGASDLVTLSLDNARGGQAVFFRPSSNQMDLVVWDIADVIISGTIPTGIVRYVAKRDGDTHKIWFNGKLFGTATSSAVPNSAGANPPNIGARSVGGANALTSTTALLMVARTQRAIADAQCQSLSVNPWQLFIDPDEEDEAAFFVSAGVAAALAGSAVASATATGALSTSIRLAGAASVTAVAVGALSTSIRLAGGANAATVAAGALTTSITLTGAASVISSATGSLTAPGAGLSGSAACAASTTAALTTGIALSGGATCAAEASGTLAGAGAPLSGSATCSATTGGALTTGIRLIGTGGASVFAAGALTTQVRLAGVAAASAQASAELTMGIIYARAPSGAGYAPQRNERSTRPTTGAAQSRPAATQRNNR